ncbi:MAG: signal recognition particle-docking protein FtsY [Thiohalomonadales bacterium]
MFGFNKNKSPADNTTKDDQDKTNPPEASKGFFARLTKGLSKTRNNLNEGISTLVLGQKTVDGDLLEEVETLLLSADVGLEATQTVIANLTQRLARKQLKDPAALFAALKEDLLEILQSSEQTLHIEADRQSPFVILMIGINGAGKTTTIGKLCHLFQQQGKRVMLAAGDTFRAAAVEQLQEWGRRNKVPIVAQHPGADPASVIYDALESATAKKADILIADTAGRLHTQSTLMDELKKIHRVASKLDPTAPHEVLLVLDASIGQNAIVQASQFHQAVGVTGIALTKLDGTAKGGVVFAIAKQLEIPIRYIGIGEGIDDLRVFNAKEFVEALFVSD